MRRDTLLKIQFVMGIFVAYALLIGSFLYYLRKQHVYTDNTIVYAEQFRNMTYLLSDFENDLLSINRIKSNYFTRDNSRDLARISEHSHQAKEKLRSISAPNALYDSSNVGIGQLEALLLKVVQIDSLEQALAPKTNEEKILALALEEDDIHHTCDKFVDEVSRMNEAKVEAEETMLDKALNTIIPIALIALLVILFVLYKTYQIIEKMRQFTRQEKRINADFTVASKQIEDNNWVLQRANEIYANLSGIDNVDKICKKGLEKIGKALSDVVFASAIYVRELDSNIFTMKASQGFLLDDIEGSFEEGSGLLGNAVKGKQHKIFNAAKHDYIKLRTTFIDQIASYVMLVPLQHDNETIGLLEIAGNVEVEDQNKVIEYLNRASRTIASAVKFGQNHTVVENLLEKTQKQTEELEAQQEELRITNEELVHKTSLLESSEEELRVQQEELSQTNLELNEKAKELEEKNLELVQAQTIVEQKISEVQQASKYKTEFMANMSHELRTPLNSILILAKLLQDNKHKNLSDDQVKYASVIHSAGSDLLELINELLDLAKIEAGKVDIVEENIKSNYFKETLESLFKEIAEQKNIDFSIDLEDFPTEFISDEHRVEQILKNFLSNAFKFTEQNGRVHAHFYLRNNYLHFEVSDSGKGISKEKQDVIFEAFRQEDGSTSRKYGGTGLGLTISREIAILLDGYITLESELGKGSTFTLVIPHKSKASDEKQSEPIPPTELELPSPASEVNTPTTDSKTTSKDSRTILIVEDDFNFADILKDFAENFGFQVLLAHDGATGIELAKQNLPDAIILDVMLPVSDGWEVLRTLKENNLTKHIPIHMMSAANYNPKEILEKGAIGFLAKPVSEDKIEEVFSNILLNIDKDVKKLLLVEDQEELSDFIKSTFAEKNINVLQAYTIESALNKLSEEGNIDCVILDISLPDGDGLKLLEEIKNSPTLKHIPVIINTAKELTMEQTEKIARYTKSMVLKNGKSTNRLIDEVNLFLSKINDEDYKPIQNIEKFDSSSYLNNYSLQGKKVLIVDDDMRNVFALTTSLQDQEMDVEIANNGREALNILTAADSNFDIVLMDIMMPEMDGYEAIEAIRKEKRLAKLPIIAVTAKAMKGDREKSIQLGANDYVSKPIDINKLISLMQVWLS